MAVRNMSVRDYEALTDQQKIDRLWDLNEKLDTEGLPRLTLKCLRDRREIGLSVRSGKQVLKPCRILPPMATGGAGLAW
jgi:hypothetical protein